jgi:hypothetical protein
METAKFRNHNGMKSDRGVSDEPNFKSIEEQSPLPQRLQLLYNLSSCFWPVAANPAEKASIAAMGRKPLLAAAEAQVPLPATKRLSNKREFQCRQ